MTEIKDYIEAVEVNDWILQTLKKFDGSDRLGTFIKFKLKKYPNEEISAVRALEWFKHILALMGYQYPHIEQVGFDEMAECWVSSRDHVEMRVRHKYWSYKKSKLVRALLKTFCEEVGIVFDHFYQERNY